MAENITSLEPEQVIEKLRELQKQIPGFVHLSPKETESIGRVAAVNPRFVNGMLDAIDLSPDLANAVGRTAAELHADSVTASRWDVVIAELKAMLKGVVAANVVRRHGVGVAALQAYNIARQLVRQKKDSYLLPHVQAMTHLSKWLPRRKASPSEPPPPEQS